MKNVLLLMSLLAAVLFVPLRAAAAPGGWPEPRQNPQLTALQVLPGSMRTTPVLRASLDRGRSQPAIALVSETPEGPVALALHAGGLYCFDQQGQTRWFSHPAGLNFDKVVCVEDLDGDGAGEVLLTAGRSAQPYGAAVMLSLQDGAVRWRYDVEPMSYAWYLYADAYWPGVPAKQIVVIMHGYPPDAKNGYMTMFAFDAGAPEPKMQWRYEFSEYTCFPSFLQTDLDGDNTKELVVESHSRMWFLDARTGVLKDFVKWDVSPANMRSYGHIEFTDLDRDGREDFFCIASFAQHHEVLLNRNGKLEKAWHHGWGESVTTGQVATRFPLPPYGDVDGDGHFELTVSMFNAEGVPEWMTRVYDAVTGEIKYRYPGFIATQVLDVTQDDHAEILGNACAEPTGVLFTGAKVLSVEEGALRPVWEHAEAKAVDRKAEEARLRLGESRQTLVWNGASLEMQPREKEQESSAPQFAALPALAGPAAPVLLAAELEGKGRHNLIVHTGGKGTVFRFTGRALEPVAQYASDAPPVLADVDGDQATDLVVMRAGTDTQPVVEASTPLQNNRPLWKTVLPAPARTGLPAPRQAYLRALRRADGGSDVYCWAGVPQVHSAGLDGKTGGILWDKDVVGGSERYWGASVNYASAWDFDADGDEDLIFTNPDYYCVAEARTGESLLGPLYPPEIFKQPSQGLYTCPVLLEQPGGDPMVALVSGHYFQGAMSLRAAPVWYKLPVPGEARCNREAFLRNAQGQWLMGHGREDGQFACVSLADGQTRWLYPAQATCSDPVAGDVDGDGQHEFVFGTSHGQVVALGDDPAGPRVVWTLDTGAAVETPILADLDADGSVELICSTADGWIRVFAGGGAS